MKKLWRCNQWWNKRCRARVYTINNVVKTLNKFHTHEEIIKRKKRVAKKKQAEKSEPFTNETAQADVYYIVDGNEKKEESLLEEQEQFVGF